MERLAVLDDLIKMALVEFLFSNYSHHVTLDEYVDISKNIAHQRARILSMASSD
jgi:hypothetical protein